MSVNCFIYWWTETKVVFAVKDTSLLVTLGNCFCEVGFGGSDCSFDISSPPFIWESTPTGTCDKSLHQCSRIYFNGRYFLENVDKNCFITKQFVSFSWGVMYFCLLSKCIFPTFIKISYLPYIFVKIDVTKTWMHYCLLLFNIYTFNESTREKLVIFVILYYKNVTQEHRK